MGTGQRDALQALRHAVTVAAHLDEEAAAELCDRIEAVVDGYDGADSLERWLDATVAEDELDEWATGIITKGGYVGIDLSLPSPHDDAIPFPSIHGDDSTRDDSTQRSPVTSLLAQRWTRAVDRFFAEGGSAEAKAELDAAEAALAEVRPVSLFHAARLRRRRRPRGSV